MEDNTTTPTLDAIWGTQGFEAFIYHNRRTNEMRVATSSPGADWVYMGHTSHSNDTSQKMLNGIHLTYLAVESLFRMELSRKHTEQILHLLPVVGKFQGNYWESSESTSRKAEELTFRDLNHFKVAEALEGINIEERVSQAMKHRSIQEAMYVLKHHAPVIPEKFRPQLEFVLSA